MSFHFARSLTAKLEIEKLNSKVAIFVPRLLAQGRHVNVTLWYDVVDVFLQLTIWFRVKSNKWFFYFFLFASAYIYARSQLTSRQRSREKEVNGKVFSRIEHFSLICCFFWSRKGDGEMDREKRKALSSAFCFDERFSTLRISYIVTVSAHQTTLE